MRITCTTPQAAAAVLSILHAAHLQVRRDFTIQPVFSTEPPIIFTILGTLTPAQRAKIRAIPDTTVGD